MNNIIIWSPASEEDFTTILKYLQNKWSSRVISKFINKLDDNVRLILEDPKIFPVINKELQIRKSVIPNTH
jgi:plasmid stabilization system protein ParE